MKDELIQQLERIRANIAANRKESSEPIAITIKGRPIPTENQLSLFSPSEIYTPTPNALIRSALFSVMPPNTKKRDHLERQSLVTYGDIEIQQTGPRLSQDDFDVWEQCIRVAVEAANLPRSLGGPIPPNEPIRFHITPFAKALGKTASGKTLDSIDKTLERLAGTVIRVRQGKRTLWGPLIQRGAKDENTGFYSLLINPDFRQLFTDHATVTLLNVQQRRQLTTQLSRWLHSFYSSHAAPFPLKVSTIKELCGSTMGNTRKFKSDLRKALSDISEVTGWVCAITGDTVSVQRPDKAHKLIKARAGKSQAKPV